MGFLAVFILVINAFSLCFCIIFHEESNKSNWYYWGVLKEDLEEYFEKINETEYSTQLKQSAIMFIDTFDKVFPGNMNNFKNPLDSFIKTIQMLSGEFSIDPFSVENPFAKLIFLLFVMTSFVLFNLMNGMAICDIALMRKQAEYLDLKQQIRNVAGSEKLLSILYSTLR